jgi:hypothetical protein
VQAPRKDNAVRLLDVPIRVKANLIIAVLVEPIAVKMDVVPRKDNAVRLLDVPICLKANLDVILANLGVIKKDVVPRKDNAVRLLVVPICVKANHIAVKEVVAMV